MPIKSLSVLICCLAFNTCAAASTQYASTLPCRQTDPNTDRPRIGLVLGGGGARGIAHVAVLKEIERLHVPIDCIAGTSMGSLIGGLYASGRSADEIEGIVRQIDWEGIFRDALSRPSRSYQRKRDDDLALVSAKPGINKDGLRLGSGLLAGENVLLTLQRLISSAGDVSDFDQLPIPYRAVATDLNTAQPVVLKSGSLALAMRASMSIPGVFRPIEIDGRILVDGGIVDQVPINVARQMGADIIIAVDVGSPLEKLDEGANIVQIANQLAGFMTVGSANAQKNTLTEKDILIEPALADQVGSGIFSQYEKALEIGTVAAAAASTKLAALQIDQAQWLAQKQSRKLAKEKYLIEFVKVDNRSQYSDEFILARLDIAIGKTFSERRLQSRIRRLYGLNTFDLITYDIIRDDDQTGLKVFVVPKTTGPNYLETGLNVYADSDGEFLFNLRAGVLRAPLNSFGGEVRGLLQIGDEPGITLDLYQPVDVKGRWFTALRGGYEAPKFNIFDEDGDALATYRVPNLNMRAEFGRTFSNYGALSIGATRSVGEADRLIGDDELPQLDFDTAEWFISGTLDRLDSLYVPRNGYRLDLSHVWSSTGLGADNAYKQANMDFLYARAIGEHSGFFGARWHDSYDGLPSVVSQYRLGGIGNFAGYRPNEVFAPDYWLAYGGYTYELGSVLGRSAVLGGTVEFGRIRGVPEVSGFDQIHGSLYFGFDSWVGPLILGYGLREGGDGVLLLEIGRPR